MTARPILDIDTLIERPAIAIDGRRFELLSPAELSLRQSHQFGIWARRMEALQASEEIEVSDELGEIIDNITELVVVDLLDEVLAKLKDEQKLAIAQVFTGLLLRSRMGVAEATAMAMVAHPGPAKTLQTGDQTGGKSSPGSSAFSAVRRWTGSIARLWRW